MMKEVGYVLFGIYLLLTGWLLLNGLIQLHLWSWSRKGKKEKQGEWTGALPLISIQVPVYNEKYVVEGLLESLSQLHYPKDNFEVIVLDDSTDETSALVDRKVVELQKLGVAVQIVRRRYRKEYKAGALQESLPLCKGEFVVIFDADFRPTPDFLTSLLPHFSDPSVGLVQARWAHLNHEQNYLTRIQSYLLDTHFSIEQAGRQQAGYFINFCGTAGIWRKECIENAGGWDGTILSEDLDLSYRAQLKGWKIIFESTMAVPAELPPMMDAFKIQQARWTKGIMQVLRKNGKKLAAAPMPWTQKLHAFFHLSSSFVFPCLFINAFLSLPLLLLRNQYPDFIALTNMAAIGGLNLVLLTIIFYNGNKTTGNHAQFTKYYPVFLLVYMALSVQNTISVFQGIFGKASAFIRTPKYAANKATATSYFSRKKNSMHIFELAMLLYFLSGIGISVYLGDHFYLLLFAMMSAGLVIVVSQYYSWQRLRLFFTAPKLRIRRWLFLFKYE